MIYIKFLEDIKTVIKSTKQNEFRNTSGIELIKKSYINCMEVMIDSMKNYPYTRDELIRQMNKIKDYE